MRSHEELHNYQKQAIRRVIDEPELGLFLGLGLGKTAISLYGFKRLKETKQVRRMLVITTLRAAHSVWKQEASEWEYLHDLQFTILHGPNKDSRYILNRDVYVINYEAIPWLCLRLRSDLAMHKRIRFDTLVLDESTKLKSSRTKRFKAVKGLLQFFERRYLLTAGPAPNHLLDLWSQFYCLDQGETLGHSYTRFQNENFYAAGPYKWLPFDRTPAKIRSLISPKVMRLKASDYIKLPPTIWNRIDIDVPPPLFKQYKELEKEFFLQFEEGQVEAFNTVALSSKLRQFVQGGIYLSDTRHREWKEIHTLKIEALKELIETVDSPMIVVIQFRFELEMLTKHIGQHPIIAGGTGPHQTDIYIRQWNQGKIPILIVHPTTVAHALNLQAGGHTIVWYGLTWSLEEYEQLRGRLERQGQANAVVINLLMLNHTMDEVVYYALRSKEATQQDLMNEIQKWYVEKYGSALALRS